MNFVENHMKKTSSYLVLLVSLYLAKLQKNSTEEAKQISQENENCLLVFYY